jgi:methionyl-tRNA formyltransferase
VVAYGKILPSEILNLPTFGCLNIHASLLPKFRGSSPIHSALMNHAAQTGVTIITMDEKMDTGPILGQKSLEILENDNLETLHDKLSKLGAKLLIESLPLYLTGKIKARPQNESLATYTKIITKEDGHLNFHLSSFDLKAKIRSLNPWPGTYCFWKGKNLKIIDMVVFEKKSSGRPGEVIIDNGKIFVSSADKLLEIKTLQLEGRKAINAKDFLIGYPEIAKAVLN